MFLIVSFMFCFRKKSKQRNYQMNVECGLEILQFEVEYKLVSEVVKCRIYVCTTM